MAEATQAIVETANTPVALLTPDASTKKEMFGLLRQKSDGELAKHISSVQGEMSAIQKECTTTDSNGNTVIDYTLSKKLTGSREERYAQLKRMAGEVSAAKDVRIELATEAEIANAIRSPEAIDTNAFTDQNPTSANRIEIVKPQSALERMSLSTYKLEEIAARKIYSLLKSQSSGSGNLSSQNVSMGPQALKSFMLANRCIELEGITTDAIIAANCGGMAGTLAENRFDVFSADMGSGTGTTAGYKPLTWQDMNVALMNREIIAYTGLLQRRSTDGRIEIEYLQETNKNNAAGATKEKPANPFPQSDFKVEKATDSLRKIATSADFTVEQMQTVPRFISFLTDRLVEFIGSKLEEHLITGDNNNSNSNEIRGLTAYKAGTDMATTAKHFGYDEIRNRMATMEDVVNQRAVAILMQGSLIAAIQTLHVGATDGRYIMGGPANRGPMTLWDVPVVKTPQVPADTVFLVDTRPIVLFDNGYPMQIEFTDSDASKFKTDEWTAKTSIYAQQVFTRNLGNAPYNKDYVDRINSFKAQNA